MEWESSLWCPIKTILERKAIKALTLYKGFLLFRNTDMGSFDSFRQKTQAQLLKKILNDRRPEVADYDVISAWHYSVI